MHPLQVLPIIPSSFRERFSKISFQNRLSKIYSQLDPYSKISIFKNKVTNKPISRKIINWNYKHYKLKFVNHREQCEILFSLFDLHLHLETFAFQSSKIIGWNPIFTRLEKFQSCKGRGEKDINDVNESFDRSNFRDRFAGQSSGSSDSVGWRAKFKSDRHPGLFMSNPDRRQKLLHPLHSLRCWFLLFYLNFERTRRGTSGIRTYNASRTFDVREFREAKRTLRRKIKIYFL